MVIGDRGVAQVMHFSWTKRWLQTMGSWVVEKSREHVCPTLPADFAPLIGKRRYASTSSASSHRRWSPSSRAVRNDSP